MSNTTERRSNQLEDFERLENKVDHIQEEVKDLVKALSKDHNLHHDYITKVLEREDRREALHRAIIEKTLVALVWSAIVGLGALLWNTLMTHWRP